jgi:hypothetical protein
MYIKIPSKKKTRSIWGSILHFKKRGHFSKMNELIDVENGTGQRMNKFGENQSIENPWDLSDDWI